jgi:hypothetical protein
MPRPDQPGGAFPTRYIGNTKDAIIGTFNDGQHRHSLRGTEDHCAGGDVVCLTW